VLAVGIAFLTPAFYRVLMSRLPTGQSGTAAAAFSIMVDLGLGGGPILFGLIVRPAGIPAALATGAALALLAAVLIARAGATAHTPGPHPPE
jgi:predicted MFS family arabinose efflux permease